MGTRKSDHCVELVRIIYVRSCVGLAQKVDKGQGSEDLQTVRVRDVLFRPVKIENHSLRVGLTYLDSRARQISTFSVWPLAFLVFISIRLIHAFEYFE